MHSELQSSGRNQEVNCIFFSDGILNNIKKVFLKLIIVLLEKHRRRT